MKKCYVLAVALSLLFVLFGCRPGETTTHGEPSGTTTQGESSGTTTQGEISYSVDDFYAELVGYEERIGAIIEAKQEETGSPSAQPGFRKKTTSEDGTVTITREEILAGYYAGRVDPVMDGYLEQLSTTRLFVTQIRELLEDQDDILLNEAFHPVSDASTTFRFIRSEEGYLLIDALYGTEHVYLKIGLRENLLEYQEFHYYFLQGSPSPREDVELLFNYFKFTENKEAVYVRYSPEESSLQCTSIENDEQFNITYGMGTLSGTFAQEPGYVLNTYDRELNVTSYLQVYDGQIVGETYDVFDEHGQVFRYDDYDAFDGEIRLQVNFVTATGWDFVVASDSSSEQIDALTGVFLADGTKIYDDWFNYSYSPTDGFLGLWIDLTSRYEITDELFSLNQYGMNLDHPRAKTAFLDQLFLDDFEELKNRFAVEGLDFFAEDLHQELYQYVDEDIRNDLEGDNEEPIVTTGDVDAFNLAMETFQSNLATSPQYTAGGTVVTELLGGGNVVSRSTTTTDIDFDLTARYYRIRTTMAGVGFNTDYAYVLDGTREKLVEFEIQEVVADYRILSDTATEADFLEAYQAVSGDAGLSQVYEIRKISDTQFELLVAPSFLGRDGVDLNLLFEQQGITGLEDIDIRITYEFTADFDGFSVSFTLEGLSLGSYGVRIVSNSSTTIEPCTIISPMEGTNFLYCLPRSVDDILFTTTGSYTNWVVNRGTSYLRMYLEPGEYGINLLSDWGEPTFTVLNEVLEVVPYDQRFTAEYAGIYYLEIRSAERMSLFVQCDPNPTPEYYEYELNSSGGNLEMDLNLGGYQFYRITLPVFSEDRVLVVRPYFGEILSEGGYVFGDYLRPDETRGSLFSIETGMESETRYCYLPAGQEFTIDLFGYFLGTVGIDYEYLTIPVGAFDNHYHWTDLATTPLLYMTEDSRIARIDFTIPETGEYRLDTTYVDLGYSYQYAVLYRGDGTKITGDWLGTRTLTAGDYYIEYTPGYANPLLVLVFPKITRP